MGNLWATYYFLRKEKSVIEMKGNYMNTRLERGRSKYIFGEEKWKRIITR